MIESEKIKRKYRAKKYKMWKWGNTVIVHNTETGERKSLNAEIKESVKRESMPKRAKVPQPEYQEKQKARTGLSLRYTHLFQCDCIVKNSEKYKRENLPTDVNHFYAYETEKQIPRYSIAKKKHHNDYPDHELLTIKFINTRQPTY
jgi:hypothetical protein